MAPIFCPLWTDHPFQASYGEVSSSYGFFLLAEPIVGLDIPVEVGLVIRLGKAVAVPDNQFEDQVSRPIEWHLSIIVTDPGKQKLREQFGIQMEEELV